MVMVVLEVFGNCRTGRLKPEARPISRISRLTTVASTGRRMKMSVNDMGSRLLPGPVFGPRQRLGVVDADAGARIELDLAGRHHLLAGHQPIDNGNPVLTHLPRPDEAAVSDQRRLSRLLPL